MTKTPRAVLYQRVSTEEQAQNGTSLAEQLATTSRKAADMGAQIIGTFTDDTSGGYYETREGIQKALALIDEGKADTLIVANVSRLSRDREHQSAIVKRVRMASGRIVFCDAHFEETPEGDLMFGIIGGFAQYEREIIRKRTMAGRRNRAEEGVQPSRAMRPYGYTIVTRPMVLAGEAPLDQLGKYSLHPDEAPHVKFIYEQYAEGQSLRQIATSLQAKCVPTPRTGKYWTAESLSGILTNTVHKGCPTFGREQRVTDESRRQRGHKTLHYNRPAPEGAMVTLSAPAIVSEELWDTAQQRLLSNKQNQAGRTDRRWMLTGLLKCPNCGRSMKGQNRVTKQQGRAYYSCKYHSPSQHPQGHVCYARRFFSEVLEEAVTHALSTITERPDSIRGAYKALQAEMAHPNQDAEECQRIQGELDQLTRREKAAIEAQIAGINAGADPAAYASVFTDIRQKRDVLKARLAVLTSPQSHQAGTLEAQAEELIMGLGVLVKELLEASELTAGEKQGLLTRLISQIVPDEAGENLRIEIPGVETVSVICVSSV